MSFGEFSIGIPGDFYSGINTWRASGTLSSERYATTSATLPYQCKPGGRSQEILVSIGTPAAAGVLWENLLESDTTLRFRIISALNKLHQLHPEIAPDAQMTETVLAAETFGHYRSYQILDMLGATANTEDQVARSLRESMGQEQERIFRLLGLLYPHLDLQSVYLGLQCCNPRA